jgi:hypothetical protein
MASRLLRCLGAVVLLAALAACTTEGPLTAKTAGDATKVAVGGVAFVLPPPTGFVPLAAVRGEERLWVEALVFARASPARHVLAAYIQPEGFTVEHGAVSEVSIERAMEDGDMSLEQFQVAKRFFAALVAGRAAGRRPPPVSVAVFADTPRSVQLAIVEARRERVPQGASAISLILVKGRVLHLDTFGATTRFGSVDGLQQFHARWVRAVIEANTTEAERRETPRESPAPAAPLPEA